jgi:hypothetical protein
VKSENVKVVILIVLLVLTKKQKGSPCRKPFLKIQNMLLQQAFHISKTHHTAHLAIAVACDRICKVAVHCFFIALQI